MSYPTILLSSVTWALRAQRVLEQRGIRSYITKVTNNKLLGGCGYGLEVRTELQPVLHILKDAGIRMVGVQ